MPVRIALIIFVLVLIAATSCTPTQRGAAVAGSDVAGRLAVADQLLQSGQVEDTVLSAAMTPEQLDTLDGAFDRYTAARKSISEILDSPENAIEALPTIRQQHARLVQAYEQVQIVVEDNWDEYDPVARSRLERWQGQAEDLERAYQGMVSAISDARSESQRTARVMELARIVARIALLAV